MAYSMVMVWIYFDSIEFGPVDDGLSHFRWMKANQRDYVCSTQPHTMGNMYYMEASGTEQTMNKWVANREGWAETHRKIDWENESRLNGTRYGLNWMLSRMVLVSEHILFHIKRFVWKCSRVCISTDKHPSIDNRYSYTVIHSVLLLPITFHFRHSAGCDEQRTQFPHSYCSKLCEKRFRPPICLISLILRLTWKK